MYLLKYQFCRRIKSIQQTDQIVSRTVLLNAAELWLMFKCTLIYMCFFCYASCY